MTHLILLVRTILKNFVTLTSRFVVPGMFLCLLLGIGGCETENDAICSGSIDFGYMDEKIREQMGIPEGDITLAETRQVKSLSLRLVTDITSIQCFENLESLEIDNGSDWAGLYFHAGIPSYAPIEKLKKLKKLHIRRNSYNIDGDRPIEELDLTQLPFLTEVDFSGTPLKDLSMFAGVTGLRSLNLSDTGVTGPFTVLKGLTRLESLDLSKCQISDLSPLLELKKIKTLRLYRCGFDDKKLGQIQSMVQLTELDLSTNNLSHIEPLSSMRSLERLNLSGNRITSVLPLVNATGLVSLDLNNNHLSDLSGIEAFHSLEFLDLSSNFISDPAVIGALSSLNTLYLDKNSISDILPLVTNEGIGEGDTVLVHDNLLDCREVQTQLNLRSIESRGADVTSDCYQSIFCNGGEMVATDNGYACTSCPSGRTGDNCEILPECVAPIRFGDVQVEDTVRTALAKPNGDITAEDMRRLTSLSVSGKTIFGPVMDSSGQLMPDGIVDVVRVEDLTGLHCASNMTELGLSYLGSPDMSILGNMPMLTRLYIEDALFIDSADLDTLAEQGIFDNLTTFEIWQTNVDDWVW